MRSAALVKRTFQLGRRRRSADSAEPCPAPGLSPGQMLRMLCPCLDKTEISIRSSSSNIGASPLARPGVAVGQLRIADRVSLIAPVTAEKLGDFCAQITGARQGADFVGLSIKIRRYFQK
jgi:hypothetical protein